MHMADALVSPAVAVTMYAASAAAAGVSLVQLHKEEAAAPELLQCASAGAKNRCSRRAALAILAAAALVIGLLVRRPFMCLNHFMEAKLEETELF